MRLHIRRDTWRIAAAIAFVAACAYHLAALARPEIAEPSPPWRHALFAAVNAAVSVGLMLGPRGFALLFALLTAQQVYSHGTYAWTVWNAERRVDLASLIVLVAMPALLVAIAKDSRGASTGRTRDRESKPESRDRVGEAE